MRRIGVIEYGQRQVEIYERFAHERRELERRYQYEIDMLEINYRGPNWLTTGKVGGWED